MHLSYKPSISWRVRFWSRGCPTQVSHLKKFRSLTDPGRVCGKGIIIQGRQFPSGLLVIVQSFLRRKKYVTEVFVHAPRQSNHPYLQMVRWSFYETRWTKHSHSPIRRYVWRPLGPATSSLLHCAVFTLLKQISAKNVSFHDSWPQPLVAFTTSS